MANVPEKAAPTPVASTVDGEIAVRSILAPLDYGEAPQILVIGDTGAGKTELMRRIARLYQRQSPGLVLIVDDKELRPRYEGQPRVHVDDLRTQPLDPEGPRAVVVRGVPSAGQDADSEATARFAWALVAKGRSCLCVFDETNRDDLVKNAQWRAGIKWLPRNFTKGRAVGIADVCGMQAPQDAPRELWQADSILCGKTGGLALDRLEEKDYLRQPANLPRDHLRRVILGLHAMDAPPPQRGDFVLLRKGREWDGRVYKLRGVDGKKPAPPTGT